MATAALLFAILIIPAAVCIVWFLSIDMEMREEINLKVTETERLPLYQTTFADLLRNLEVLGAGPMLFKRFLALHRKHYPDSRKRTHYSIALTGAVLFGLAYALAAFYLLMNVNWGE